MTKFKSIYIDICSNVNGGEDYLRSAVSLIAAIDNTCVVSVWDIKTWEKNNLLVKVNTGLLPQQLSELLKNIKYTINSFIALEYDTQSIDLNIQMYNDGELPFKDREEFAMDRTWDEKFGNVIINLSEVESTNDYLKNKALMGAMHGTVAIAKRQTKGRGRLGRSWSSMNEDGIWLSIIIRPNRGFHGISNIAQIFAVSIVETLYDLYNIKCGIKWPNDIILGSKKLCGILCESNFSGDSCNFVIVGIGINVNQDSFEEDLKKVAISLKLHTGIVYDKQEIINRLINFSDKFYINFAKEAQNVLKIYKEHCVTIGREVKVIRDSKEKVCYAVDITENGNLLIQNSDGSIEEILSGEVSIRGINNYN